MDLPSRDRLPASTCVLVLPSRSPEPGRGSGVMAEIRGQQKRLGWGRILGPRAQEGSKLDRGVFLATDDYGYKAVLRSGH